MAKTYTAPFAQDPKTATAAATVACGAITGDTPTGSVQLLQAGVNGAILTRLTAVPRATVTSASSLVLFLATSADNYATQRLIDSEVLPIQTLSTGAAIAETVFGNYSESTPLRLAAGDRLYVGSQVINNVVFKAEYTDY